MDFDFPTYLIIAVFIASGVSFFEGLFAKFVVRLTTVVVGLVAGLAITLRILGAFAFSSDWGALAYGVDTLRLIGDATLLVYLGICVLTCVPLLPARQMLTLGLSLHFIVLPIAMFLTTFTALTLPWGIRLSAFTHNLTMALIYAMLWFRMLEKQRHAVPIYGSAN